MCGVEDVVVRRGQRGEQSARLVGEHVGGRVLRGVQPPHLARAALRGERLQHRQHRGDADARGEQDDGCLVVVQHELAAGCRDVQLVAHGERGGDVGAGQALRLALDADAVAVGGGGGQGVVPDGARVGGVGEPDGEVLPWHRRRQPLWCARAQVDRGDEVGLVDEARDPHGAEAVPRRCGRRGPLDQVAERALPAGAQRAHGQQPVHRRHVRAGQVELGVGDGDADPLCRRADPDDVVARPHGPLPQDPEVEAGPAVGHEQRGHPRLAQAQPDAVAGDARLRDLELGLADAVAVADAHLVVGQPVDGEVLAEDPPAQVRAVRC